MLESAEQLWNNLATITIWEWVGAEAALKWTGGLDNSMALASLQALHPQHICAVPDAHQSSSASSAGAHDEQVCQNQCQHPTRPMVTQIVSAIC